MGEPRLRRAPGPRQRACAAWSIERCWTWGLASGPVHKGLYFPDYASLDSPQLLCQRLADRASTLGAVFHEAEVRSIGVAGGRPASLHCSDGREPQLDGAAVIIAEG